MKICFILILGLSFQLGWTKTIIFDLPDYTLDQKVYLTGNTKALCNWKPKCKELKKVNGKYLYHFSGKNLNQTEFKVTLGDWTSQGTDQNGTPLQNTKISRLKNKFKVFHWQNQVGNFHQHMLTNEQFGQINDGILIIGSSSPRLWSTVEQDFYPYKAKSLGIGGAIMSDFHIYIHRLILKHNPRSFLFYMGENDIANHTPLKNILNSYKDILRQVHRRKSAIPRYCMSIKVSPARKHFQQKITLFNQELKKLNCHYIELNHVLMDHNGNLRYDVWQKDMLHLNHNGYKLWTKAILEQL